MLAVTPQAVDQLEDDDLEPPLMAFFITLTLPGGIYPDAELAADAVQIQFETTTDMPAGTRLEEGYPAAQATFTLSGSVDPDDASKSAAWLFGRYSTASPLWRLDAFKCPVTIDVGLYPEGSGGTPEVLRKFTGYVESYSENSDGSVAFTCIDNRSLLRNVPTLTAVPNAGLTPEYVINALLRGATGKTVSSWPDVGRGLSVGMRTSTWPEMGTISVPASQATSFAPGKHGSALVVPAGFSITYTLSPTFLTIGNIFFEQWVGIDGSVPVTDRQLTLFLASPSGRSIELRVFGDHLDLIVTGGGLATQTQTWTTALLTPGDHYIAVNLFRNAPGFGGLLRIDGSGQSVTFNYASVPASADFATFQVSQGTIPSAARATISEVGGTDAGPPFGGSNFAFIPTAYIDPSLNSLQLIPEITGDPFQTFQQIATAELAVAGLDETGFFRFVNRHTLASGGVARTITSTQSLKSLGIDSTSSAVVNRAQIGYTGYAIDAVKSAVYTADAPIKIPRNTVFAVNIALDSPVLNLDTTASVLPNGSTDQLNSYYRASRDAAGVSRAYPGAVTMIQTAPTKITVYVNNWNTYDIWLVSSADFLDVPAGTPVLQIAGTNVSAGSELTADYQYPPLKADGTAGAASTRFGEIPFTMSGNQWVQDSGNAMELAQDIVGDACIPRPDLTGVSIVPDPRLQLMDLVRIVDTDRTGVDEYARIFAWTLTYSGGDYSQTIDARTVAAPGGWILGIPGRSELADTTYLY